MFDFFRERLNGRSRSYRVGFIIGFIGALIVMVLIWPLLLAVLLINQIFKYGPRPGIVGVGLALCTFAILFCASYFTIAWVFFIFNFGGQ